MKSDAESICPTALTVKPRDFGIHKSNFSAQYSEFSQLPNRQAGKAGGLGKTAPIDAIHATGEADMD